MIFKTLFKIIYFCVFKYSLFNNRKEKILLKKHNVKIKNHLEKSNYRVLNFTNGYVTIITWVKTWYFQIYVLLIGRWGENEQRILSIGTTQ